MKHVSSWIYCRLIDPGALRLPSTSHWVGQVEFATAHEEDLQCRAAMRSSMAAFAISEDDTRTLARARILILTDDPQEAREDGNAHLHETLAIFNAHLSMMGNRVRATDAGYVQDLRSRVVLPLLPPSPESSFTGTLFMMDESAHHPDHAINTLLAAPRAFGELGDAFRRSVHWGDLARAANDRSERLLLNWMAAECLCKLEHDDSIVPKLLAASGFPVGQLGSAVSRETRDKLNSLPNYRSWRVRLSHDLEELRRARNNIVHAGYLRISAAPDQPFRSDPITCFGQTRSPISDDPIADFGRTRSLLSGG